MADLQGVLPASMPTAHPVWPPGSQGCHCLAGLQSGRAAGRAAEMADLQGVLPASMPTAHPVWPPGSQGCHSLAGLQSGRAAGRAAEMADLQGVLPASMPTAHPVWPPGSQGCHWQPCQPTYRRQVTLASRTISCSGQPSAGQCQ